MRSPTRPVLVFYTAEEEFGHVLPALRMGPCWVRVCREAVEFPIAAESADWIVLFSACLRSRSIPEHIHRIAQKSERSAPAILITARNPENIRIASRMGMDAVVFQDELGDVLLTNLETPRSAFFLKRVASVIGSAAHLHRRIRDAVSHACVSADPVTTVTSLAATANCGRATLYRHWERMGIGDLRLDDVLEWVLLLRVVAIHRPGWTWRAVGQEVRVSDRTLSRIAKRLLGMRLRDLDESAFPRVAAAFEERVLSRLTGDASAIVIRPGVRSVEGTE
ncbi:MAG TPA: hypothetical protein VLK84_30305 [Longimicrobium sp.]|nr:hypothetical protein [Longimicrobium sp.]